MNWLMLASTNTLIRICADFVTAPCRIRRNIPDGYKGTNIDTKTLLIKRPRRIKADQRARARAGRLKRAPHVAGVIRSHWREPVMYVICCLLKENASNGHDLVAWRDESGCVSVLATSSG